MIVTEPADVFDPRHYEACRRPVEVAETLPNWCYTSQAFYEREREHIFLKQWTCAGHESRVATPGSFYTFDFVGVPMIIVRGKDDVVRALVNACRHRGGEVATGAGECAAFKCPYHAWTFGLNGDLIGTPMFEESDVFRKADYGLTQVRLEHWGGFLWINFDPHAEGLHSYLGDLPERVAAWKPEEMALASHKTYFVEANWKQYYENFSDPYHVPFVHRSSLSFKPVKRRQLHDPAIYRGNYVMHRAWFDGTRSVLPGEAAFPEIPIPEADRGTFYPWVYPTAGMGFAIDSLFCVQIMPDGPERMRIERDFLVPKAYTELPDYEATLANYLKSQEVVQNEDVPILEMQQRSMHSPVYKTGRFATLDQLVHGCQNWILDRVLDPDPAREVTKQRHLRSVSIT
jgi:phenylpropionate dioxygenase-like ring-hydroxylating dioxygenase large terminal subunit